MVKGLLHAAISVSDIDRALSFYCDTLGFRHLFDINDEFGKPKTFYTQVNDTQYFEIFLSKPQFGEQVHAEPDTFPYGFHHLTVHTPSLDELEARLLAAQAKVQRDEQCIWTRDPDGNLIRFTENKG